MKKTKKILAGLTIAAVAPIAFMLTGCNNDDASETNNNNGITQEQNNGGNNNGGSNQNPPTNNNNNNNGTVTQNTVPTAVRELLATPRNERVELSWQAPQSNGGVEIIRYEVRVGNTGDWINVAVPSSTTISHTVTGLVNGTNITINVRAVNSVGASAVEARTVAPNGVTITVARGTVNGVTSKSFELNEEVILTTTDTYFLWWQINGVNSILSNNRTHTFTATQNVTITAHGENRLIGWAVRQHALSQSTGCWISGGIGNTGVLSYQVFAPEGSRMHYDIRIGGNEAFGYGILRVGNNVGRFLSGPEGVFNTNPTVGTSSNVTFRINSNSTFIEFYYIYESLSGEYVARKSQSIFVSNQSTTPSPIIMANNLGIVNFVRV